MPRIEYPDLSDPPPSLQPLLEQIGRGRPFVPNAYRMLLWSPTVTGGWVALANALRFEGRLDDRSRELAILLVSHLTGCDYEWTHHARLASDAGLTPEQIERVREWPRLDSWDGPDRALLGAVGAIVGREKLPPELAELRSSLGEEGVVELTALVAYYLGLAHFLLALDVELEPEAGA